MIMIGVADMSDIGTKTRKNLTIAQKASALSDFERIKIGAVIVKKNKLISIGVNSKKTHPIQKRYNDATLDYYKTPCVHAEIAAIINARDEDLRGATIYVYRDDRRGAIAEAKPCLSCSAAIRDAGISTCFYSSRK